MLIRELRELIQTFEDEKEVSVFLELAPNYGVKLPVKIKICWLISV